MDNQELQSKVDTLERQIKTDQASIDRLIDEKEELKERNKRYSAEHYFFDRFTEIVGKGSNVYHKYDCKDLNIYNGVLILHPEVAQSQGYVECPYCH